MNKVDDRRVIIKFIHTCMHIYHDHYVCVKLEIFSSHVNGNKIYLKKKDMTVPKKKWKIYGNQWQCLIIKQHKIISFLFPVSTKKCFPNIHFNIEVLTSILQWIFISHSQSKMIQFFLPHCLAFWVTNLHNQNRTVSICLFEFDLCSRKI